jgi:hypothetical protein
MIRERDCDGLRHTITSGLVGITPSPFCRFKCSSWQCCQRRCLTPSWPEAKYPQTRANSGLATDQYFRVGDYVLCRAYEHKFDAAVAAGRFLLPRLVHL